jgi:glucose-6-phosphate isomerase
MTAKNKKHKTTCVAYDIKNTFEIDFSGMKFSDDDFDELDEKIRAADVEMRKIEAGEIKNPDENRKVTHFIDRKYYSESEAFRDVQSFAENIKSAKIKGPTGKKFESAVINGIGGSALGPQFLQFAVNGPYWNEKTDAARNGWLKIYFSDNTDSAGIKDLLEILDLEKTIIINISKSGTTQETKNNMIAFSQAYSRAKLDFPNHACAITMEGSELDRLAKNENWLKIFHMADSVGGRTSETSIVGHLPATLAGIDFKEMLAGACKMDSWTREQNFTSNPAYMLAIVSYLAGKGRGDKNMVIVPYSDRLILLSRYLQQLVMESVGKERDLDGKLVCQGLNVFGNKGGTDAHAFIQQLNDGKDDFFATFIEVLKDAAQIKIEDNINMGDYLHGFQAGLTNALLSKNRQVITIRITEVSPFNIGMLIALYERAVAFYAELIHINAFHQPGVQAYKLASKEIIKLQKTLALRISEFENTSFSATELADKIACPNKNSEIEAILAKFAENAESRKIANFKLQRKYQKDNTWSFQLVK